MKKNLFFSIVMVLVATLTLTTNVGAQQSVPRESGQVCTMEAKLCPDGSSVGRVGPNCEFAPCPARTGETHSGQHAAVAAQDSARAILGRFAAAWRGTEEFILRETTTIAFWVHGPGGGTFHVVLPADGPAALYDGRAKSYTLGFQTDIETLRKIDRGEWNALTAMGQARSTDPIPLVPKFPGKFEWTAENRAYFIPLFFHFWNREWPEAVRFGSANARLVHGGNGTVLFYDRGLRSAWYQISPGMHINRDPEDQANPFPSLIVMVRGRAHARIAGEVRVIGEGEAIFVPAGTKHELWADEGESAEFILIMWGADA